MIWRGLFILTILSNCVLSLPVTSSQLENEDVKVMKCIVEALADVLSRPHPMPVSQECLVTLKTDDRLVTILRHHNFLKELQEIAVQGGRERAELQRDAAAPDPMTQTPQTADEAADQSMLEALGGPGERSILSQKKRRTENEDREEEKDESRRDGESRDIGEEVQVKRGDETGHESHVSESVDEWTEGKAEKREEEEEEEEEQEEEEEKRANSEEETMTKDKKGAESEEKRDAPRNKPKEKKFDEEDMKEEKEKRSSHFSHGDDEELIEKRSSRKNVKRWTKRGKGLQLKKKADVKEAQEEEEEEEVPHHSKEVAENRQEEEKKKKRNTQRSPEEKELQMIARRAPEEKRGGSEEEGSAGRKSEEPEIESLAAIESELEDVAQKLHELRRG